MIFRLFGILLFFSCFLGGCTAATLFSSSTMLKGSENTIIMVHQTPTIRGRPQLSPGEYFIYQASDLPKGRSVPYYRHRLRGKSISNASMDLQSGTLRFSLDIANRSDYSSPICLVIVGPNGKFPVRPNAVGEDIYHFRNPLWEAAIGRLASVRNLGDQLISIRKKEIDLQSRIKQSFKDLQGYNARSHEECKKGPVIQAPKRWPTVVEKDQQGKVASQVCAAVWRDKIGSTVEKLYSVTNKNESWEARNKGQILMEEANWKIQINMNNDDLKKIQGAGRDGELFIYYEQGVSKFLSKTVECETSIAKHLDQELRRWEEENDRALSAPTRFLDQCQDMAKTYNDQKAQLTTLKNERKNIQLELDSINATDPKEIESTSLDPYTCSSH